MTFKNLGKRVAVKLREGVYLEGQLCELVCSSILPQHFLLKEDGEYFDLRNSNYNVIEEE
jgi:hypothetical protein